MDTLIKLVLILFISLLSFSVGTYVGKRISDREYKNTSFNDEYKILKGEKHQGKAIEDNKKDTQAMEIVKLAKEFIQTEKETEQAEHENSEGNNKTEDKNRGYKSFKPRKEESSSNETIDQSKKEGVLSRKVAHLLKEKPSTHLKPPSLGLKTSKELKKTKVKSIVSPVSIKVNRNDVHQVEQVKKMKSFPFAHQAKYTIQVASYVDKEEAEKHVSRLKAKHYSAFHTFAKIKGKIWYRVNVGLYPTKKKARDFQKELKEKASISSSIITKLAN